VASPKSFCAASIRVALMRTESPPLKKACLTAFFIRGESSISSEAYIKTKRALGTALMSLEERIKASLSNTFLKCVFLFKKSRHQALSLSGSSEDSHVTTSSLSLFDTVFPLLIFLNATSGLSIIISYDEEIADQYWDQAAPPGVFLSLAGWDLYRPCCQERPL
jgi:hypothetical protein